MANRRNPKGGLIRLLEQSRQPIYALDEQRRIFYANPAVAQWLETPLDQIVGLVCNYHSRSDANLAQRIAASLCPPPEAFAGTACDAPVGGFLTQTEGQSRVAQPAHFWPVTGELDSPAVIAFVDRTPPQAALESNRVGPHPSESDWHLELAKWRRDFAAVYRLERVLGMSEAMRGAQRVAKAAIASGADTLIVGPPGGGMEQLARAIHYSQFPAGSAAPLVPLDCASGDAESLQIALRQVQSDRERTAKGRLLLLHADRMDPRLMHELAEFARLPNFEVGILSTSETSLRNLAARQQFDSALAQYLGTLEIHLPPLRDRVQDLPLLCQALIEDFNAEGNRQFSGIDGDALEMLSQYPWPRNMDELAQMIHAACLIASGPLIRAGDLPKQIQSAIVANRFPQPAAEAIELASFLKEIENELMRRAIRMAKGNKAKAARLLGVSRQRVIRWSEQKQPD